MPELQDIAYHDLRQFVVQNWKKVRLLNEVGEEVYSNLIPNGSKIRWTHATTKKEVVIGTDLSGKPITSSIVVESNPKMILRIQVTGADLTLPCSIASVEVVNPSDYDKSARIKRTLDSTVPMAINADTFTFTLNFDFGEFL